MDHSGLDAESNFGPIATEYDLPDLPVLGRLPRGLNGTLFRNGPNPQFAPLDPGRHHWFVGDGMIHAFTLREGHASYTSHLAQVTVAGLAGIADLRLGAHRCSA